MATGKLKIDIRRQAILEQVNRNGQVFVTELSKKLGATPVTIRTDLDTLAAEGRLERIQGGAISIKQESVSRALENTGFTPCLTEKQAIAEATAVAVMIAPRSIPEASRMFGFTARM